MNNPLETLEKSFQQNTQKVKALINPLRKLGVVDFIYNENFSDDSIQIVTSVPNYILAVIKSNHHNQLLSTQNPNKFGSSVFALSTQSCDLDIRGIQKIYGYERNGVCLIKKYNDSVRMYFFQCRIPEEENLIKNQRILEDFIIKFHCNKEIFSAVCKVKLDKTFGLDKNLEKEFYLPSLSHQQENCLKLLIEGKSTKEISQILGLKINTVVFYIKIIRQKTNTKSKSHLIIHYFNLKKNKKVS